MDPLTQILAIIRAICETYKLWLESLPEAERAAIAKMQAEDLIRWREFFDKLVPKG